MSDDPCKKERDELFMRTLSSYEYWSGEASAIRLSHGTSLSGYFKGIEASVAQRDLARRFLELHDQVTSMTCEEVLETLEREGFNEATSPTGKRAGLPDMAHSVAESLQQLKGLLGGFGLTKESVESELSEAIAAGVIDATPQMMEYCTAESVDYQPGIAAQVVDHLVSVIYEQAPDPPTHRNQDTAPTECPRCGHLHFFEALQLFEPCPERPTCGCKMGIPPEDAGAAIELTNLLGWLLAQTIVEVVGRIQQQCGLPVPGEGIEPPRPIRDSGF